MHIVAIRALSDNYIWAICDTDQRYVAVVDPGDAKPVIDFLTANSMLLTDILITHHHQDHTGGVPALLDFCSVPVWNYNTSLDNTINLEQLQLELKVLAIPGHTLDHIAFWNDQLVFCGDTLFSAGCGKIFEGTAVQMFDSIQKLKKLPSSVNIYCGHEYTLNNLKFAAAVEPNNPAILQRLEIVQQLRAKDCATVPTTLLQELSYNPFLRTDNAAVRDAVQQHCGKQLLSEAAVFAELRLWKNGFMTA